MWNEFSCYKIASSTVPRLSLKIYLHDSFYLVVPLCRFDAGSFSDIVIVLRCAFAWGE